MVEIRQQSNFEWKLFSVQELAALLGISSQTLYNRLSKNAEKPFPIHARRIGRLVRFDSRDVERYLDSL